MYSTPRPWKIHSLIRLENPIPEIESFNRFIECEPTSADQEFAEMACNTHEDLVTALQTIMPYIREGINLFSDSMRRGEYESLAFMIEQTLLKTGIKQKGFKNEKS